MVQCGVCHEAEQKYKCPKCYSPYCSLPCFKCHSCTPLSAPSPTNPPPSHPSLHIDSDDETDVLDEDQLSLLNNQEMKEILSNPHLRRILTEIDGARDSQLTLEQYEGEPLVQEFIQKCLGVLWSQIGNRIRWSRNVAGVMAAFNQICSVSFNLLLLQFSSSF